MGFCFLNTLWILWYKKEQVDVDGNGNYIPILILYKILLKLFAIYTYEFIFYSKYFKTTFA